MRRYFEDNVDNAPVAMLCAAPSALMAVLKGERKGPISFCADPSCLHDVAGIQTTTTILHNKNSHVLCRYWSTSKTYSKTRIQKRTQEIVWFRIDAPEMTLHENNRPLTLRSCRMKLRFTSGHPNEQEPTIELFNTTEDIKEMTNFANDLKYQDVIEIGMRIIQEGRDRCLK